MYPQESGIFGKPLEQVMEQQVTRKPDLKIPEFLIDTFQYILRHGDCQGFSR